MDDKYDIIIVGGGPAGSVAATVLAQSGHNVVIVDKSAFPRHKPCGDFIAPYAINFLADFKFWERFDSDDIYPVKSAEINFFNEECQRINFVSETPDSNSIIMPRYKFDNALMELALSKGADFLHAKFFDFIRKDSKICGVKVESDGSELNIRAKIIIGADGSNSRMAKLLNGERQKDSIKAVGIRAYIDNFHAKPHTIEAFFQKIFWPGYTWIFPVSDSEVNIGLGYRLGSNRFNEKSLKRLFLDFLESPQIKSRMAADSTVYEMKSSILNLGFDKHYRRVFDGALLIGDAANLVNPLTGGGICNAMISGKLAAETVKEAFSKDDFSEEFLSAYSRNLTATVEKEMKYSEYLYKFFITYPTLVRYILKYLFKSGPLPSFLHKMYPDVHFQ